MDMNKQLTAAEWYQFLMNEVKMPQAAKDEVEELAQALEHHFMSKNLFIDLSEDDLRTRFRFERIGLLSQFTKWKNSLSKATTQTENTNSILNLVDILKIPVSQNQIGAAMSMLSTNSTNVSQIVPNYLSVIDAFQSFGENVPESERVYYRCKACDQCVWVLRGMSVFVEFPGCFKCQKDWVDTLGNDRNVFK